MEKSVPEECSFCHRYQQKICREVSFYFFARFCTNQGDVNSCMTSFLSSLDFWPGKLSNFFVSQFITWWAASSFSGCFYGSQSGLLLACLNFQVLLSGFLPFYLAPQMPFPQTTSGLISLAFEAWLLRTVDCPSSWLPGG